MTFWIFSILGLTAGLLFIKMAYVIAVACTIGTTQGALFVSTSRARIHAVLDELRLSGDQVLIDLGCGDGRALRAAQKRFGVRTIGYEINPLAYAKAKLYCAGRGHEIRCRDFRHEAVNTADVIFCYLFPDVLAGLVEKIKSEAKPGAIVVSFNFPLPELTPVKILRPRGWRQNDPIYFYRMSEAATGEIPIVPGW